jgi:signal peptidase I
MEFLLPGESEWIEETQLKDRLGMEYPTQRLIDPEVYSAFEVLYEADALDAAGLEPLQDTTEARMQASGSYSDRYFRNMVRDRIHYQISPHVRKYGVEWRNRRLGWHIGENHIFPMGDNRDNSEDARYFHAVKMEKVLGRASFRFWPIARLGGIR